MHYLDTNIIIYSVVNQDPGKMEISQSIIRDLFEKNKLLISPLNLQELIFTLSKLKIEIERIEQIYFLFHQFCHKELQNWLLQRDHAGCDRWGRCRGGGAGEANQQVI